MKQAFISLFFASSVVALLSASPAMASKVALIIGNADYAQSDPLANPLNDARAIRDTFEALGFKTIYGEDLTQREFAGILKAFDDELADATVAAFYYAGHGVQYEGQNYLVSTDAELDNPFMINSESIPLDLIIQTMESHSSVDLLFVDACRQNQFAKRLTRGPTPVVQGLAPTTKLSADTLIMYATASNEVALDGDGKHSPFAAALIQQLIAPDTEIGAVMKRVIRDVRDKTSGLQSPEVLTRLSVDLYLKISPPIAKDLVDGGYQPSTEKLSLAQAQKRLETLWAQGLQYQLAGDDNKGYVVLNHALNLATWYFGEDSEQYGQANNRLVGALTSMGRVDDAIYASTEAIRVFSSLWGENSVPVLVEKGNLAARLRTVHRSGSARELYLQIIDGYQSRALSPGDRMYFAHALEGYAQYLSETGDRASAVQVAARSVEVAGTSDRTASIDYGWILSEYGFRLREAGRCNEASAIFSRAVEAFRAGGVAETQSDFARSLLLAKHAC